MKLRTVHILYYLCLLCTLSLSAKIDRENQSTSNPSGSQELREATLAGNANTPRDKRALGLILSGLAQVFGYTVNPVVQIASLPNPNSDPNEARATQSSNDGQTTSTPGSSSNSTQSNGSSTTAAPRQRETIRFTGVVNLGNSSGLLTHLQQYERIFHGGNSSTTSQPPSTTSSTPPPQMDLRTPATNQPLLPPLLVKIPLPAMPEPPLPTMSQPPLPEIPPLDIQLSYPEPFVSIRNEQEIVYRKNESTEKLTVENKNISDGRDVHSSPPPTTLVPYTEDPRWKKEYEDRLTELERKQEEQAQRLRIQEWYRNRQKEYNYSGEKDGKGYDNRGKQIIHGGKDSECREEQEKNSKGKQSSEVEDESGERYESAERMNGYTSEKTRKPVESEEEKEEGYMDRYKGYEDAPFTSENYTNIQYNEPLPLSNDDEQRRPDELRNSYGEPLYNRELFDNGFINYFEKLEEPLRHFYASSAPPNSKEEISLNSEEVSRDEDDNRSSERSKEKQDTPARNKYEEYSLEEATDTERKDQKSNEYTSKPSIEQFNNFSSNGEDRSHFEEQKTTEELDFAKYMPLVVPVRYLSAPEELKEASRFSMSNKSDRDNNVSKTETVKKVSPKEPKPRKENLKPTVNFLERPEKLHEGEQKELQMWPPPFDFVLDSTIHTNVVPATSSYDDSINDSNTRQKVDSPSKRKSERQQQHERRITLDNSTRKPGNIPENIDYQGFTKGLEYGTVSGQQLMFNRPVNSDKSNNSRFEVEETKSDQNSHRKELPDYWERYKYTYDNNYKNTERPNIKTQDFVEQVPRSLHSKKHNIEKPETTVANYYSVVYPTENKEQTNVKHRRMPNVQVIQQKIEPTTTYNPRPYNYYDFGGKVYEFDYGRGNERMSRVFEDDKKVGNEEAIRLPIPQQHAYQYDESLTKFASEPESRSVKVVGDYTNAATTMKIVEQERISPNRPISYVDYSRIL